MFIFYLLLVLLGTIFFVSVVAFTSFPRGRRCSICQHDTLPIEGMSRKLDRMLRKLKVGKRWCLRCDVSLLYVDKPERARPRGEMSSWLDELQEEKQLDFGDGWNPGKYDNGGGTPV